MTRRIGLRRAGRLIGLAAVLCLPAGTALAGAISGTVTDAATGTPLAGVDVWVVDSGGTYTSATTGPAGAYTVSGLSDGTYYASTWNTIGYINEMFDDIPCLNYCDAVTGTPITVSGGGTTSGIDFALTLGGRVSGTVAEAGTGTPLANIAVAVVDASGNSIASASTDASGAFLTYSGVPSGTYFLRTYNGFGYINQVYNGIPCALSCTLVGATPVTVTAGATASGYAFLLQRGAQVAGSLRDAATSTALAGVWVGVYTTGGTQVASGQTDAAGAYLTNPGLPAGNYYLRTSNSQGYVDEIYDNVPCLQCYQFTGATAVALAAGSTTSGIDFALDRGGRISGFVTEAGTGTPIVGTSVWILDALERNVSSGYTDATGFYETETGLPTGSYFVRTSNGSGYVDVAYPGVPCVGYCSMSSATPVAVTVGSTTTGIDLTLNKGGRVSGTVRDATTLAPVANVSVTVATANGARLSGGVTNAAGAFVTSTGLPSGTYYALTINNAGYINEVYDNLPCAGCNLGGGTAIPITAPATTAGIDFDLRAGGRISGRVTDAASGDPLSNVSISVYNAAGTYVSYATTDAFGNYLTQAGLPAGSYYLRTGNEQGFINQRYPNLACNGNACPTSGGTAVAVTLGATTPAIDFALARGGRVSGTVTDAATGLPLETVNVQIVAADGTWLANGITNTLGAWISGAGLASGTYYAFTSNFIGYINQVWNGVACAPWCSPAGGTPIVVTVGSTTPGVSFALQVGGSVRGVVTDVSTGAPLADVTVRLTDAAGNSGGSSNTDSLGRYEVGGLPAGSYYAQTSNSQGYVNEVYDDVPCLPNCTVSAGAPIGVTLGAATTGVDFALARGGRISGRITDAATGLPLGGVRVLVVTFSGATATSASTDLAGNYITQAGLVTGTYFVRTANGQGYINQVYPAITCVGGCTVIAIGTPLSVTAGSTLSGIDFSLGAGGRIAGQVTDASSGAPIGGVSVNVFAANGRSMTYGYTDTLGNYLTQEGLPGGTYYLRTDNSAGFLDELYDNKACLGTCTVTNGTPVTVSTGSTTSGRNFALSPGAQLAGHVRDAATSAPIPGVTIQIADASGRYVSGGWTDDTGAFVTAEGLPPGTYYARTSNGSGYVNELYGGAVCASGCVVTTGTPIVVSGTGLVSGIDFDLAAGGRISGTVVNSATLAPLANVSVQVLDSAGTVLTSGSTNSLGNYLTRDGLPTGSYLLRTSNGQGYVNQVYNGLPCLGSCDVTAGTPVAVTAGATTPGIGFALAAGARVQGTVTNTGLTPLANVTVDVLDGTGRTVASGVTDGLGVFLTRSGVPTGSYYVRTENSLGYVNQFWNAQPCVTSCTVAIGNPLALTAPTTTLGIAFALSLDTDALDGDGIASTIDKDLATGADESTVYSNDFNDVPLGGTTSGTITGRGGFTVTVGDVSPGGVRASVSGAGTVATLETCPTGGTEGVSLDAAGETALIACTATTGSTWVRATTATPVIELRDPPTGPGTVVLLTTDQAATIGSPVTADPGNTQSLHVLLVDASQATVGSFDLDPGESVDAAVQPTGTVTTTVVAGTVTVTVGSQSATLSAGQTHAFTYGTAAEILGALLPQVDAFLASHDIRNPATARVLKAEIERALAWIGRGQNVQARHTLELLVRQLHVLAQTPLVKPVVRDTLVPQLRLAIERLP